MTAKAVRHEEGDSEFIGNPFFSCIHSKFSCLTSWLWSHCKSRELADSLWAGSEDFPMVQKAYFFIYWVFNSFQPRPKHFYQTVFCGNRATTRLFQLGVKKRTRLENNSVNAAQNEMTGWSLACPATQVPWFSGVKISGSPDSLTCTVHPSQWGTPHPATRSYSSQGLA